MTLIIKEGRTKNGWGEERVILISGHGPTKSEKILFRVEGYYSCGDAAEIFTRGAAAALKFLGHEVKIKRMEA